MSRDAQRLPDYLAHGYFKIDFELVWKTIHRDLPSLRVQIEGVLVALGAAVRRTPAPD